MKFKITYTDYPNHPYDYETAEPPCKGAWLEKDFRTQVFHEHVFKTLANTNWWFADGVNHRTEDGIVKRDFPDQLIFSWFAELKTAEDFISLNREVGCPIIISYDYDGPEIEIYNGYRE